MEHDPRVTVTILDRTNPYRFAEVRGQVVETVGGEEARRHIDELSHKYNGSRTRRRRCRRSGSFAHRAHEAVGAGLGRRLDLVRRGRARRRRRPPWWWRLLRLLVVGALVVGALAWRERKFAENEQRFGLA